MGVSIQEQEARFVLSQCMVEILRPGSTYDVDVTPNERLLGYTIAAGVYSGAPMGIVKLAEATGLAKSTVRGVVSSMARRGWLERRPDRTFVYTEEFHRMAGEWFDLPAKYRAILRAAEALRLLGYAQSSTSDESISLEGALPARAESAPNPSGHRTGVRS